MTYQLIHGDCLDVLGTYPDKGIDVVITDPPYGIGESQAKVLSREKLAKAIDYGKFTWDFERVSDAALNAMLRVSSNQLIFGGNHFADVLPASPGWIVWDKQNSGDFSDCELAWTSYNRGVRIIRYMWNGMIKQKPEIRYHPTQKPIDVMRWAVVNYSKPGDTILDPFMGSGTTGVAAVLEGRNFIGIELDAGYYAIAEKRIAEAAAQPKLFEIPEPQPVMTEQAMLYG